MIPNIPVNITRNLSLSISQSTNHTENIVQLQQSSEPNAICDDAISVRVAVTPRFRGARPRDRAVGCPLQAVVTCLLLIDLMSNIILHPCFGKEQFCNWRCSAKGYFVFP
jgi:hypothetical protein